mmetsp:Transcript_56541/g.149052  ORF Transcript_56541/g.149052 Transcript_56541/m.149052 type:complete len:89 (+) Transcript_56541:111-377(+)
MARIMWFGFRSVKTLQDIAQAAFFKAYEHILDIGIPKKSSFSPNEFQRASRASKENLDVSYDLCSFRVKVLTHTYASKGRSHSTYCRR